MKQSEATKDRPFYSVSYQYKNNPWTAYSCHRFDDTPMKIGGGYRTMPGVDDLTVAIKTANLCVKANSIVKAWVHVSHDCYNHTQIYEVKRAFSEGEKL